jgi:hypothetical protein
MNPKHRFAIVLLLTPIIAALLYTFYFRESRNSLMDRLVSSGVIALYNGGMVTRSDMQEYFRYPPEVEGDILKALVLTPEDVSGLGQDEKDFELLQTNLGQLLLQQTIKHIAIIKYLDTLPEDEFSSNLEKSCKKYKEELMFKAMEKDLSKVSPSVTDEEMMQYYINNPTEFHQKGKRLSRHVMIDRNKHSDPESIPSISEIQSRLEKGEDFHQIILDTQSENSTQDGNLGWLQRGALHQTFDNVLWAMDVGEITGPIRVGTTEHFLHLIDEQEEGLTPFNQCKPQIKKQLEEKKRTLLRYKLLGLPTNEITLDPQSENYRNALLQAAYAREWDKNIEIVRKTESYRRYQKAELLFQKNVENTRNIIDHSRISDSIWVIGKETVNQLLDHMYFRMLVKLNTPTDQTNNDDPM